MSNETQIAAAEHALTEFRREISVMTSEAIDLLAVERRVQELTNAFGPATPSSSAAARR